MDWYQRPGRLSTLSEQAYMMIYHINQKQLPDEQAAIFD